MCPSPSFLLCVVLHGLPKMRPDGGKMQMSDRTKRKLQQGWRQVTVEALCGGDLQ